MFSYNNIHVAVSCVCVCIRRIQTPRPHSNVRIPILFYFLCKKSLLPPLSLPLLSASQSKLNERTQSEKKTAIAARHEMNTTKRNENIMCCKMHTRKRISFSIFSMATHRKECTSMCMCAPAHPIQYSEMRERSVTLKSVHNVQMAAMVFYFLVSRRSYTILSPFFSWPDNFHSRRPTKRWKRHNLAYPTHTNCVRAHTNTYRHTAAAAAALNVRCEKCDDGMMMGKKSIKCCVRTKRRAPNVIVDTNESNERTNEQQKKKIGKNGAPTTKPKFRTWKKRIEKHAQRMRKGGAFSFLQRDTKWSLALFRLCAQWKMTAIKHV